MSMFTVSLVQLNSGDNLAENIATVEKYVRESAARKADFVCLPENTFFMKEAGREAMPDQTEGISLCRELAQELGLWILIGSVKIPSTEGKAYNRSLLINSEGEIAAQYDKIHLFDVALKGGETYNESSRIESGKQAVIADTPWGKLGMTVCYDLRFPQLYRSLAKSGALFLTVPSAFTHTTGKAHWHALLRARAIENGCYVFAPAQCGIHPGNRRTYGHSLAVSPWGEIIAEASEDATGITTVQVDTSKVSEVRSMIPSLSHDREFMVKSN